MNKTDAFEKLMDWTGDYYQDKTLSRFLSQEGWFMLFKKDLKSIEVAKKSKYPNIYLCFHDVLDSLTTQLPTDKFKIGLTYHSSPSITVFSNLREPINKKSRETIESICREFPDSVSEIRMKTSFKDKPYEYGYLQPAGIESSKTTSEIDVSNTARILWDLYKQPDPVQIDGRGVVWQVPILDLVVFKEISWRTIEEVFPRMWSAFLESLKIQSGKGAIAKFNREMAEKIGGYHEAVKRHSGKAENRRKELIEIHGIDPCSQEALKIYEECQKGTHND